MTHIIVGIDSGKRAALACIDLNGKVVRLNTGLFVGLDWYIDNIKAAGLPVLIAGDKKKAAFLIEKMSAIFGTAVFTPRNDISVRRKKEFMDDLKVATIHERDALSAALTAYNAYANKLKQAERYAKERGRDDIDNIKALVIKKYSIHEALEGRRNVHRLVK